MLLADDRGNGPADGAGPPGGPGVALLGPVAPDLTAALAAAGLPAVGSLADRFAPGPGAAGPGASGPGERFAGVLHVLAAAEAGRVVAAVVAPPAAALLPDLVAAGLPVLLAEPGPWDPDLLTGLRVLAAPDGPGDGPGAAGPGAAGPAPGAVEVPVAALLRPRCAAWAVAADAALQAQPDPPVQVVVRGWGGAPAVEAGLVDLLLRWCGDVVAVCAAPHALPAAALPDGEPVAWALLTETGATVLLAPGGRDGSAQVRVSLPERRLVAGPGGTSWSDGTPVAPALPGLPLLGPADAADLPWTAAEQAAAALAGALRTGTRDGLGRAVLPWPWPPDLVDLLPVARVLAARDRSVREQRWVELA